MVVRLRLHVLSHVPGITWSGGWCAPRNVAVDVSEGDRKMPSDGPEWSRRRVTQRRRKVPWNVSIEDLRVSLHLSDANTKFKIAAHMQSPDPFCVRRHPRTAIP
jgi:hypothetical protein